MRPKASVLRHITKLRELGLVRRVKRHLVNQPAVYVRCAGKSESMADDKTLKDVILQVVTKPMRTTEVVPAVLEAGWKTTMIPGHFRTHVISRLRQAGFREVGGKWERVG